MDYIHRSLERKFLKLNGVFKALLLTGARQTGKTTMLRHLAEGTGRTYVSLDTIAARELATQDPRLFFQMYPPPVLVDEVQYAPQLFPYIKVLADASDECGRFWLTGSQHYAAMRSVQESLAGRVGLLEMLPLSQAELAGVPEIGPPSYTLETWKDRALHIPAATAPSVFERIWRGGMPGAQHLDREEHAAFFESYAGTYLLRDVMELGGIYETSQFLRFLTALAALTGQQLNYATLAETTDVSQSKAKEWVQILDGLGIIWLLPPFSTNVLKRLVRTPKLYFNDTGLAAFLARWPTPDTLQHGPSSGAFLENYVVQEIRKLYLASPQSAQLSYYRNKDGKEIDLIVDVDRVLHPLEIKQSTSPKVREAAKFSVLDAVPGFPRGHGGIVCLSESVLPITQNDNIIPASIL